MLKKNNKKNFFTAGLLFIGLVVFLFLPALSLAQGLDAGLSQIDETIVLGSDDPRVLIARIIQIALGFLGIIAVGLVVYAGFLWMTSGGNEEKVNQAKSLLKNAVIGLIIILMAFSIASFIIRAIMGDMAPPGSRYTPPPGRRPGGMIALGGCSIASVYPENMQTEVPRNTSIMVTFKEAIDPATICDKVSSDNKCASGAKIIPENVHIFRTENGDFCQANDACDGNVKDVYAFSKDNKTFVFIPANYLGSDTDYFYYSVYLSNSILTQEGRPAFAGCRADFFEWMFEVSNIIDLTPPQVRVNGVFPPPDNERDELTDGALATQAIGKIEAQNNPNVSQPATASISSTGGVSPVAVLSGTYSCSGDGQATVVIEDDGGILKTRITSNLSGWISGSPVAGRKVALSCGLELELTGSGTNFSAGNSWELSVAGKKDADRLRIDNSIYTFVSESPHASEISVGDYEAQTAENIKTIISANHSQILIPEIKNDSPKIIDLKAVRAGSVGNRIVLESSSQSRVVVTAMSGGEDAGAPVVKGGAKDQPMNTAIQINFNEAVLPLTVSGDAEELSEHIRVKCLDGCGAIDSNYMFNCGADECVKGKFVISNQYRTVEFVSNNKCAVNGCGEDIYCLPANSKIEVSFDAASLTTCQTNSDCVARSPFTTCDDVRKSCRDSDGDFYPGADSQSDYFPEGVMDAALNSLDGNRDNKAKGPIDFYNENESEPTKGDSFKWSFIINDKMEVGAPVIKEIYPRIGGQASNLSKEVEATFDKLLMSGSLLTGSVVIDTGREEVEHRGINLTSASAPVGYWIVNEAEYTGGYPSGTKVFIKHSGLGHLTGYKAQFGSAIKDIYQNCYLPSGGVGCDANNDDPSCCEGSPYNADRCP